MVTIYSISSNKVFCFCCKLFKKRLGVQLANDGYNDWHNLSRCLASHETSREHMQCMTSWLEMERRLQKSQTIDASVQIQLNKETRFVQFKNYDEMFGFLFSMDRLHRVDDESLLRCCKKLEKSLEHNGRSDIDGEYLFSELTFLKFSLPDESKSAIDILNYLKMMDGCFPHAHVAYKILLTIPVTVASAERSFSKLKLIKTYLRSTMSQERLNGLAMLSIEKKIVEELDYTDLINTFASKTVRRVTFN